MVHSRLQVDFSDTNKAQTELVKAMGLYKGSSNARSPINDECVVKESGVLGTRNWMGLGHVGWACCMHCVPLSVRCEIAFRTQLAVHSFIVTPTGSSCIVAVASCGLLLFIAAALVKYPLTLLLPPPQTHTPSPLIMPCRVPCPRQGRQTLHQLQAPYNRGHRLQVRFLGGRRVQHDRGPQGR